MSLDDVEVITTRSTFRLAQRRASYQVLEYRCPVIKVSADAVPQAASAPATLFDGSLADVSFIAGMLVDKFCYHLPLYRQHQRLLQAGIPLSRTTLTQQVARAAALLSPIHLAMVLSPDQPRGHGTWPPTAQSRRVRTETAAKPGGVPVRS